MTPVSTTTGRCSLPADLRLTQLALVLALSLLSVGRAVAEPTAAERETARSLMDEADRLHESGDLWGALERFKAADQLMHAPTTGLELARMQAALLQLVEARGTALNTGNLPVTPGESKVFADARKAAHELAAEIAPRVPDVSVLVEPGAAQSNVAIDGVALPHEALGLPFKLNPGTHMVVVQAAGYEQNSQQISLAERQHAQLHVVLNPLPPPVSSAVPPPVVAPKVSAEVATAPVAARTDDSNAAGRTRGYVALTVSGVVLAVGGVIGILAIAKSNTIKNECPNAHCQPKYQSDLDSANTLANIANVTIPLGLLGAGYGIVELLTHPSAQHEHASGAQIQVGVNIGNPGAWVQGRL